MPWKEKKTEMRWKQRDDKQIEGTAAEDDIVTSFNDEYLQFTSQHNALSMK